MPGRRVGVREPSQHGQSPTTVSLRGERRSCGRVSHYGKTAMRSAGRKAPRALREVLGLARRRGDDDDGGRAGGGSPRLDLPRQGGDEERPGAIARGDVDEAGATDLIEDVTDIEEAP